MSNLYFIECPLLQIVKIGRTVSVRRRLRDLQTTSPIPDLVLLASFKNRGSTEKHIHLHWLHHHYHHEWFFLPPDLRQWILCGAMPFPRRGMPTFLEIGNQVKSLRTKMGLSRGDLAERIGSKTACGIKSCESGRQLPSIRRLRLIAEVLRTDFGIPRGDMAWWTPDLLTLYPKPVSYKDLGKHTLLLG